jgi:hypothetical protein
LIGWNWLERGNLIHAIQGLHNNVEIRARHLFRPLSTLPR